jgi:lipopolysaccharide/colanic/teichoic acid biosynthesis glycosyltransferase
MTMAMPKASKRLLDLALALPALAATAPLVATLAALVRVTSQGPAFYVQTRVGRGRRPLRLFKLRSMRVDADRVGPHVTAAGDPRVTRIGALLRRTKLDELPQLWNVVRGDMSLVGPRPEAERYVSHYRPEWQPLLDVRPGITDLASLVFRDEESLLAGAHDRERAYVEAILPAKLKLALEGVARSSLRYDLEILLRTVLVVLRPGAALPPGAAQALGEAAAAIERLNRTGRATPGAHPSTQRSV